jgi:hypothetical protein
MMVAKGNPKAIATIDGLVRGNVRTSMPKPVNEASCNLMRELPRGDSLRDEVSYATGALQDARHRASADDCRAFLATKVARDACANSALQKPAGAAGPQADRLKAAARPCPNLKRMDAVSRIIERLPLAVASRAPAVPFRPADAAAPQSRWIHAGLGNVTFDVTRHRSIRSARGNHDCSDLQLQPCGRDRYGR